ncbi:PREDICTED: uncharacterized protein LOC108610678 [Drosophila arizonae]|uniref:Uncharacterized protein LOC108610678 n=1 Tax=Drosophila arizonae TaxID=7263 RepID=A0ABM1NTX8_DROAR|nr:PREDICTED: uncharacterized protein LOC108610678 [Drosophila arizonae]
MDLCYLTSNMSSKSRSAPELYMRSAETQTQTGTRSTRDTHDTQDTHDTRDTHDTHDTRDTRDTRDTQTTSVRLEDTSLSHETSTNPYYNDYIPPLESERESSRIGFLSNVYVLLIVQVGVSTLQWLVATYRMRLQLSSPERNFTALVLFLIWLNLTLAFFGFRRLQLTAPINWIVFVSIFESLTLLVMCLCTHDMELTWPYIVTSIAVVLIYTPLGLWLPAFLTVNLWILIFLSISVLITSTIALVTRLAMHLYVPLTVCQMLFGPWTMYNAFQLHAIPRESYRRYSFLKQAAQMYIAFGCTVGGLVVVSHIANDAIEIESCKAVVFCEKRSISLTYGPGN